MTAGGSHRPEIQGLRAIAVGLVLIFHIWPAALPGGFVGVDVFFVISGYLIVGSLVRQAERDGRISLLGFYSRRVRRLLPAASVVLAFVFAGTFLWLPQARWNDTFIQIAASALYIENWYLAWSAVDYLAAENTASPVQHYWSLSIEEQFYIVWPFIMLAVLAVARSLNLAVRHLLGASVLVIFAASLTASVWLTHTQPGAAYFVSHTRVWELALGGLLAIWLPAITAGHVTRALIFLAGLAAIIASGLLFDPAIVPFPGYTALLPTVGAGLIILAGDFRLGLFRGLNYAPLRALGDISYSVYLWHWPLIVFYLAAGYEIGLWEGLALLGMTLALSVLTYVFVEEWFRHPDKPVEARTLPYGLVSVAVIVGGAAVALTSLSNSSAQPPVQIAQTEQSRLYPGPAALVDSAPVPAGVPLKPSPILLLADKSSVYDSGCHQSQQASEAKACEFGDRAGPQRVAVVGSSHSVNWLPAIDALGRKNGWQVVSLTKSACYFSRSDAAPCNQWHDNVVAYLRDHPVDLVVIGEYSITSEASRADSEQIAIRWKNISDLGVPILAIQPTPHLATDPADCLPDQIARCVTPRRQAERGNTVALAAASVANVKLVNMNDTICAKETCDPVVGNLVVFRDKHHLTQTYAVALAPYLEQAIAQAFPGTLSFREGVIVAAGDVDPPKPGEAVLKCSALSGSSAFTRNLPLTEVGNRLVFRGGDWQERTAEFEVWEAAIIEDRVYISGRYVEGGPELKPIEMVGTILDGTLVAAGQRGPRICSITRQMPPAPG